MLYAIGRNINKYHRFLHGELKKFEGKMEEKAVQKRVRKKENGCFFRVHKNNNREIK